jgi:citrate synthase
VSTPSPVAKGLDNVVVDRSSISWVGGETGDLVYRGFDVRDLAPGLPYESAVHLLLTGDPPAIDPSPEVVAALRLHAAAPPAVEHVVDSLAPSLAPLDALRSILSALGDGSFGYPPTLEQGYRLIAQTPVLLARFIRRTHGLPPVAAPSSLSHAAQYLTMLGSAHPSPERVAALDAYLVLLADHGMNASTFALRIAVSTQSDFASAATAALAVLKGPVHGGAPSRVSDMLDAVGTPENADRWIAQKVAASEVLM